MNKSATYSSNFKRTQKRPPVSIRKIQEYPPRSIKSNIQRLYLIMVKKMYIIETTYIHHKKSFSAAKLIYILKTI